jgi:hypothetical protein
LRFGIPSRTDTLTPEKHSIMPQKPNPTQGSSRRSERLSLAVTAEEKEAVEKVAQARGMRAGKRGEGYANLLRVMALRDVLKEYRRLQQIINPSSGKVLSRAA